MLKGMSNLMKQMQLLQTKLAQIQEELASKRVEASSGGGMVTVVADGQQNIMEIKISKEVVNPDEVEMLEDLILAAVNEARKRAQELAASEMSKLTGGLSIPGLF
ncbi:MAG: YbaB/EbfC family nucleoid-associated protein [Candidatus Edwardsbacteria bacterium]